MSADKIAMKVLSDLGVKRDYNEKHKKISH